MTSPFSPRHHFFRYRLALLISMIIIVPVGYVVRFAKEPGPAWLHDALGSVAYEIFWILFVAFVLPKTSPLWTAVGVCLATCGIEFLQLWQPPFLQAARATLPGRLVLGNSFAWSDFPAYFIGSFLGWIWMRRCKVLTNRRGAAESLSGGFLRSKLSKTKDTERRGKI